MKMHLNKDPLGMVAEFCTRMEQPVSMGWEATLEQGRLELGKRLLMEEFRELMDALADLRLSNSPEHRAAFSKELADLLYVTYWQAATIGLDLNTAFKLVHVSNLSKLGLDGKPVKNAFGKVIKGPNYCPADLSHLAESAPITLI